MILQRRCLTEDVVRAMLLGGSRQTATLPAEPRGGGRHQASCEPGGRDEPLCTAAGADRDPYRNQHDPVRAGTAPHPSRRGLTEGHSHLRLRETFAPAEKRGEASASMQR